MTSSSFIVNTHQTTYQGLPELFNRMRRNILIPRKLKVETEAVTVGRLLSPLKFVPGQSVLLGRCKDGLPFLIQLIDPEIGAILISGDKGCGKTHQLQVMVNSAMRLNQPHELQVSLFTHNPDEWRSFWSQEQQEKYLGQIKAWYDPGVEEIIDGLIQLAEARREGRRQGASIMLVLDDFNFVESLSYETQVKLHWLLAYGAQSSIWIVAAIKSLYSEKMRFWIETFRTRIVGLIENFKDAKIISPREDSAILEMEPGEFRIWTGKDWSSYKLPLMGD